MIRQARFLEDQNYHRIDGYQDKGFSTETLLSILKKKYGKEKDRELGIKAYTYLIRRFGLPKSFSPKEVLGTWILKAPDTKFALIVQPDTLIHTVPFAHKDIGIEYMEWLNEPLVEWEERCDNWAAENKGTVQVIGGMAISEKHKHLLEGDKVRFTDETGVDVSTDELFIKHHKEFYEWKGKESNAIRAEYNAIDPYPIPTESEQSFVDWFTERHQNDNGIGKAIYDGITAIFDELIQPVYVDNSFINLFGIVDIENPTQEQIDEAISRIWQYSDRPFIEEELSDYDKFWDLSVLAYESGNGDLLEGFMKQFALLKNAKKLTKKKDKAPKQAK